MCEHMQYAYMCSLVINARLFLPCEKLSKHCGLVGMGVGLIIFGSPPLFKKPYKSNTFRILDNLGCFECLVVAVSKISVG